MHYALQMMRVVNWSWRCRGEKEHKVEEDMHKVMNVMMEVVMKMKMGGGFEEDGGAGGGRSD